MTADPHAPEPSPAVTGQPASVTPRIEARMAAGWWAVHLTGHGPAAIGAFNRHLADQIEQMITGLDEHHGPRSWRPEQPYWASALRVVSTTEAPGILLRDAARLAGFEIGRGELPQWTEMHIDPGSVLVTEGRTAPQVVVWDLGCEAEGGTP